MKRIFCKSLATLGALFLLFILAFSLASCKEKEGNGLEYKLYENTGYVVVGIGTNKSVDLVIPAMYKGLPVVAIDEAAFVACVHIRSATIPSSVTTIGKNAFAQCYNLKDVFYQSDKSAWEKTGGIDYLPEVKIHFAEKPCTHEYIEHEAKSATCLEDGWNAYVECKYCDYSTYTEVKATGHIEAIDNAISPSCTEAGMTEGKHCSVCGEVLIEQVSVPATGHTEVVDRAVAPTCTEPGLTQGTHCMVCNTVLLKQEIIDATGHTEVIDKAVSPTCTDTGFTKGSHCSVCNTILLAQEIIGAVGHTEIVDKAVAPTCTDSGLTEGKHCSVCSAVLVKQEPVDALGHSFSKEYISTSTHHFYRCACGEKDGEQAHVSSGNATATEDEICTICKYVITPALGITFKTLSFEGSKAYLEVPNDITVFSFVNEVVCIGGAKYIVSYNVSGENELPAKAIKLNPGDNTVYVIELKDGEPVNTYTITIHRRALFTVSFVTENGVVLEDQIVEEGSFAVKPDALVRTGYDFMGWNYDFSNPIMKSLTISAIWQARNDTEYKIEYYLENFEQNGYKIEETLTLQGTSDEMISIIPKSFAHFTLDTQKSITEANLKADGSLVFKVYYTRNSYKVSNMYADMGSITNEGTYVYGSSIQSDATVEKFGCIFVGWYSGDKLLSSDTNLSFDIDCDVQAKFAPNKEMENFVFTSDEDSCFITGVIDNTVTEIVIPEYVVSIEKGAFAECKNLVSIKITFLGDGAENTHFGYIFGANSANGNEQYVPKSLRTVVLSGITEIPGQSFYNCRNLTKIIIPESVLTINYGAFENCSSIVHLAIPDSVTTIGDSILSGCSALESITLPFAGKMVSQGGHSDRYYYGFGYIFGTSEFEGCVKSEQSYYRYWDQYNTGSYRLFAAYDITYYFPEKLCSVTLTKNLNFYAFAACSNLRSINLGNDISYIPEYAFAGCIGLKSFIIPESIYAIGEGAFSGCKGLSEIRIPNSITTIGMHAFQNCSNLTSVTIGEGVTSIGGSAFGYCHKLVEIINHSKVSITAGSSSEFDAGYYAKEVHMGTSKIVNIDDYLFYTFDGVNYLLCYIGNDKELVLPESYNGEKYEIYQYAFNYCTSMTSIMIPESVTSIGSRAFYNCTNLKVIKYRGTQTQWSNISKAYAWNEDTGAYTIIYNYEED